MKYFIYWLYPNGLQGKNLYPNYKTYSTALRRYKRSIWLSELQHGKIKDSEIQKLEKRSKQ